MKQIAIFCDGYGYTKRLKAIQDTGLEVVAVTPNDFVPDGYQKVTIPENWLPQNANSSASEKIWLKANTIYLAAVDQLKLEADFFWVIEGDCVASVSRWKKLFDDHKGNKADLCSGCLSTRLSLPRPKVWSSAPDWAKLHCINALQRVSQRAVQWNIEAAEEMRDVFSDVTTPSIIEREGGTFCRINRTDTHFNMQTMRALEKEVIFDPNLINHPVKANTYEFEGLKFKHRQG